MADDAGKFARGIAPHVALVATGVAAGLTAQQLWPDVKQAVSDLCSNLTDRATAHFTAKNKELVTAAVAAPHEDGLSMHNVVSRHVSDAREVRMPAVNSTAQTTSGSAQGKRPVSSRANSTRHDMRLRADTEMSEDDDDDDDEIAALKQQLADAEKRKRAKKSTTVTGAVQASQVDPPTPARKMPSRASAGRAETRWKGMLDADKRVDPQETVQAADVVEAATPSSPATGAAGGNNDLSEHSHAGSDIAGANADDGNDQVNEKLLGMLKLASDDLKAAAATGEVDKLVDGAPGWVVSWKPRATVDHAKGDVYFKYGDGTHPPLRSIKDVERFLTTHGNGFSCDPPPDAQLPPPHVALLTPIPMGFDAAKLEHRLYFQGATIKVWWSADVCEKPGWFKATVTDVGNDPEAPGMLMHFLEYPADKHQTWTQLTNQEFKIVRREPWLMDGHTNIGRKLLVKVVKKYEPARVIAWLQADAVTGDPALFKVELDEDPDEGGQHWHDLEAEEIDVCVERLQEQLDDGAEGDDVEDGGAEDGGAEGDDVEDGGAEDGGAPVE